MGKVFNYVASGRTFFDSGSDEVVTEGIDFQYEVSWQECREALVNIIFRGYFKDLPMMMDKKEHVKACKKAIEKWISDYGIEEELLDAMEEDLKEYFEDEAFESLNN